MPSAQGLLGEEEAELATWAMVAPSRIAERTRQPEEAPERRRSRRPCTTDATSDEHQRRGRPSASDAPPGPASIPTETKNSTANRSRNGVISAAAWCDSSDSLTSRPATNAPSARTARTRRTMRNAAMRAVANTASRNSSGEPSRATEPEQPRQEARADDVGEREEQRGPHAARGASGPTRSPPASGGRSVAMHEDRDQVLDDHPADRRPAVEAVQLAPLDEELEDDQGRADREAAPTTTDAGQVEPEHTRRDGARDRRAGDLQRWRPARRRPGPRRARAARTRRPERTGGGRRRSRRASVICCGSPTNPGVNGPMRIARERGSRRRSAGAGGRRSPRRRARAHGDAEVQDEPELPLSATSNGGTCPDYWP